MIRVPVAVLVVSSAVQRTFSGSCDSPAAIAGTGCTQPVALLAAVDSAWCLFAVTSDVPVVSALEDASSGP